MRNILAIMALLAIVGCSKVAFSGRKQLNIIPNSEMNAMATQSYGEFLKTNKISGNQGYVNQVNTVGNKIKAAAESYFKEKGLSSQLSGFKWEFNVVESKEVNAWAMPGGKIVFYEGIMPVCESDAGVAVVMAHEVAHVIAKHGGERMSQQLILQFGGAALSTAIETKPEKTKQIFNAAFGAGSQVGILLPYSRSHEKEADAIGQYLMAIAGYDPAYAVTFWQKMEKLSGKGASVPEFLSTHPSNASRIADLKKNIPEAMKYSKK